MCVCVCVCVGTYRQNFLYLYFKEDKRQQYNQKLFMIFFMFVGKRIITTE